MSERSYFEPDPLMHYYQIHSGEEFVKAYLVKGDFGPNVPEDLINSYKTAEYLMAHSYYYWPMYDEAFWKVLGVYEMAVKVRCAELEIELHKTGYERKKDQPKPLGILQDELIKKLNLELFRYTFDKILKYRNEKAHPVKHTFGGTFHKIHIEMIVKVINLIFETIPAKTVTS
jgi:hypothetical protein